jgi:hypothetical protein
MDVYLPPPARRIKHPEGLIEQRIDRVAGNPSLSLSCACSRATPTPVEATLAAAGEHQYSRTIVAGHAGGQTDRQVVLYLGDGRATAEREGA